MPTSPHLRDLLLRLANLESVAARGRAIVAAFTEATEAAEKSAARGEAAAEAELAKHRAQVEEQEADIVSYTLNMVYLRYLGNIDFVPPWTQDRHSDKHSHGDAQPLGMI